MKKYYILSLKWTKDKQVMTWWRPNSNGYCFRLDWAGKYTQEEIDKSPDYYNNGESTLAIPCKEVEKQSIQVIVNDWGTMQEFKTIANKALNVDASDKAPQRQLA